MGFTNEQLFKRRLNQLVKVELDNNNNFYKVKDLLMNTLELNDQINITNEQKLVLEIIEKLRPKLNGNNNEELAYELINKFYINKIELPLDYTLEVLDEALDNMGDNVLKYVVQNSPEFKRLFANFMIGSKTGTINLSNYFDSTSRTHMLNESLPEDIKEILINRLDWQVFPNENRQFSTHDWILNTNMLFTWKFSFNRRNSTLKINLNGYVGAVKNKHLNLDINSKDTHVKVDDDIHYSLNEAITNYIGKYRLDDPKVAVAKGIINENKIKDYQENKEFFIKRYLDIRDFDEKPFRKRVKANETSKVKLKPLF